jgi:hypothetical protein
VKKCEYCYPKEKGVLEIIKKFRDSEPTPVQIKDTLHLAYKVLPDSDMWQTWCTIEFSMKKKRTFPKSGFDIRFETVHLVGVQALPKENDTPKEIEGGN